VELAEPNQFVVFDIAHITASSRLRLAASIIHGSSFLPKAVGLVADRQLNQIVPPALGY